MAIDPLPVVSWLPLAGLLALLAAGCATPAMVTPARIPAVASSADAMAASGRLVQVSGTAGNAKLGAVVQAGDLVVYCQGMNAWPDADAGQVVTVRGTLEQTSEFEAPDAYSTGTQGPVWVLRGCARVP